MLGGGTSAQGSATWDRVAHDGYGDLSHACPSNFVLCRQKILKEKAVPMIEGYMFEEHEMIRRAATECMCNLAMSKEVRVGPAGGHDRDASSPAL